jgi:hypothetical protein
MLLERISYYFCLLTRQREKGERMSAEGISRRGIVGAAAGVAAGAVLSGGTASAAADEREFTADPRRDRPERPNLLVILGDDLGWADLGSYGSPDIRTPDLDRLAGRGDWKYLRSGTTESLFNLAEDVREQANLATRNAPLLATARPLGGHQQGSAALSLVHPEFRPPAERAESRP